MQYNIYGLLRGQNYRFIINGSFHLTSSFHERSTSANLTFACLFKDVSGVTSHVESVLRPSSRWGMERVQTSVRTSPTCSSWWERDPGGLDPSLAAPPRGLASRWSSAAAPPIAGTWTVARRSLRRTDACLVTSQQSISRLIHTYTARSVGAQRCLRSWLSSTLPGTQDRTKTPFETNWVQSLHPRSIFLRSILILSSRQEQSLTGTSGFWTEISYKLRTYFVCTTGLLPLLTSYLDLTITIVAAK